MDPENQTTMNTEDTNLSDPPPPYTGGAATYGPLSGIENYFELRKRGSTWLTEIRAGCVTFVTMAYILAVNASIISETGGPCQLPSGTIYKYIQMHITIDVHCL